jgi:hypothetical protein
VLLYAADLLFVLFDLSPDLLLVGGYQLGNLLLDGPVPAVLVVSFALVELLSGGLPMLEGGLLLVDLLPESQVVSHEPVEVFVLLVHLNVQLLLEVLEMLPAFLSVLALKHCLFFGDLILDLQDVAFRLLY